MNDSNRLCADTYTSLMEMITAKASLFVIASVVATMASPTIGDEATATTQPATRPSLQTEEAYLSAEQRLRLFDLEQADLRLGHALTPFTESVRVIDGLRVRMALADDFVGTVASLPAPHGVSETDYSYTLLQSDLQVDATGFVDWITGLTEHFETIETVSFARDRNGKEILLGRNGVAESAGAFRIAGVRRGGGPIELAGRFLLRHRGMDDGYLTVESWIHGLVLEDVHLITTDQLLFEEVTASTGIEMKDLHDNWGDRKEAFPTFTGGVYLGDVDEDGHLDLLVTEFLNARFYRGNGDGTFVEVGWQPRDLERVFPNESVSLLFAAIFDADADGQNDVLCGGTLYHWEKEQGTLAPMPVTTRLPNNDIVLGDYDRDGKTDVYLLDAGMRARQTPTRAFFDDDRVNGRANRLLKNLGGGKFKDVTRAANASPGHGRTFAAVFFYANDDPWPDLFGANEFGRNVFLINQGDGRFEEVPDVDRVFGGFSMGVSTGDLDGDGRSDLYVSNMYSKAGHRVYHHLDLSLYPEKARPMFVASVNGNRYYRSRGDSTFQDMSVEAGIHAVGWGWSGAIADFNLDGWLDVYAPSGHTSVSTLRPDG